MVVDIALYRKEALCLYNKTNDVNVCIQDGYLYMLCLLCRHTHTHTHMHACTHTQDEWLECQRNWLYLESIFGAPDIQRQLPNEAKMFTQVDKSWKEIMRRVHKFPNCIKSGTHPGWFTCQMDIILCCYI